MIFILHQTEISSELIIAGKFELPAILEPQMLDSQSVVDQFLERIDADAQMCLHKFLRDLFIASGGLDAAVYHRLV